MFGSALVAGGRGDDAALDAGRAIGTGPGDVTYTKDIAPILQRSCENCHRADGVAPMSLTTYEEVRPWARAIKQRTGIGPHAGVMPPWYIEKNIGIQKFKNDPSLSDDGDRARSRSGPTAARRAATRPTCRRRRVYADRKSWAIGTPDLIVKTTDITVKGERARLVGRDSARADPARPKIATSRRSRSRKSTTSTSQRQRPRRRSAAASCSTT